MNIVLCYEVYTTAFPCFCFLFFFCSFGGFSSHSHTGNLICKQGNVCRVRRMHTLWIFHNASTSLTFIIHLRKRKTVTGLVLLSKSFFRGAQRDCRSPLLGHTNITVIYSADFSLTRSTSLFRHRLLLITPPALNITVQSLLSVSTCPSCFLFLRFC